MPPMAVVTVTVLFTDMVGSTNLLSRVGETAAEELRREHFGLLRAAIDAVSGREVKNLGDGLMVAFDGVGAALACAVAMQQALAARPGKVEPLAIRVGVASGEADVEDGDYFGLPVVEAARLCAKAGSGEILTTGLVRMLARSRGGFDLVSVGELELKGLDEPVEAFRVAWEPVSISDASAMGVPQRVVSLATSRFVGRVAERELLASALKEAELGDRRLVLLSGEPGIGKTTLASWFALDAAAAGGVSVLYGRCDEELFIPYQPWVEALDYLVEHVSDELIGAHVGACGAVLGRVVPALWRRAASHTVSAGSGSDESDRSLLFAAVVDLLARASEDSVLVVLLDDLHWADAGSVQLLRHVLTANRSLRVLVIATFRDSDVGADHVLADALAAMHREHGVQRVPIRGLGDDELLAFMEVTAGHDMNDDGVRLRDVLLAETDGNPFFVGEMLQHLSETGALFRDDSGTWMTADTLRDAGLPVSIREVVGRRVLGLGAECHRVLAMGAVIGRDFDFDLLQRVVDVDADRLIDLCDTAVGARVLSELANGGYTFTHALIERALYDELSGIRRSRAHRAVAEALEEIHGDHPGRYAGQLAHHWASALTPTDAAKVIDYAHLAGDHALTSLAPEEAVRWYSQALERLDTTTETDLTLRARLLFGLGNAQRQTGVDAFRGTLLDAAGLADRNDDIDLLVQAALANTRGFASEIGKVDAERVEILERAIERLGDGNDGDRARLLAQSGMERVFSASLEERLAIADDAVACARRSGNPAALVNTLQLVCQATIAPHTLDRRIAWSTEACQLTDNLADPTVRCRAHGTRYHAALEDADLTELRARMKVREEISDRLPDATLRWNVAVGKVTFAILAGDLEEAEHLAGVALTLGVGQPDALKFYGAQLINIRLRQGRLGEMVPLIEQAAADNPGLPAFQAVLAMAYVEAGDDDRAHQIFDDARNLDFPAPENMNWSTLHVFWADLAIHFRDQRAAEVLGDRIAPFADHITTASVSVDSVLGHFIGKLEHLLGRYDEADRSFRRAIAIHERLESPPLIAMTQSAWSAMLVDRDRPGDHDHARTLANQALETAERSGYGTIERDARAVLDVLGEHQESSARNAVMPIASEP